MTSRFGKHAQSVLAKVSPKVWNASSYRLYQNALARESYKLFRGDYCGENGGFEYNNLIVSATGTQALNVNGWRTEALPWLCGNAFVVSRPGFLDRLFVGRTLSTHRKHVSLFFALQLDAFLKGQPAHEAGENFMEESYKLFKGLDSDHVDSRGAMGFQENTLENGSMSSLMQLLPSHINSVWGPEEDRVVNDTSDGVARGNHIHLAKTSLISIDGLSRHSALGTLELEIAKHLVVLNAERSITPEKLAEIIKDRVIDDQISSGERWQILHGRGSKSEGTEDEEEQRKRKLKPEQSSD